MGPDVVVGEDVYDSRPLDPLGMIEAHASGGAGAAVMPGDKEFAIAELLHDFDLVLRHRAERIIDVVLARIVGADTIAIAAQISRDDVEMFGQTRRYPVPGDVGQRVAV